MADQKIYMKFGIHENKKYSLKYKFPCYDQHQLSTWKIIRTEEKP